VSRDFQPHPIWQITWVLHKTINHEDSPPHTGENPALKRKLVEEKDGDRLNPGAACMQGKADSEMETAGEPDPTPQSMTQTGQSSAILTRRNGKGSSGRVYRKKSLPKETLRAKGRAKEPNSSSPAQNVKSEAETMRRSR